MLQSAQEVALIHDRVNTLFGYNQRLRHLFHGLKLTSLLVLDFPYFSKTPFADNVVEVEAILGYILAQCKARCIKIIDFAARCYFL